MEHIGLKGIDMSLPCPMNSASLNKIKSISFTLGDDREVISLANNTVLKHLELDIFSDSANHKMLSAIRQSDNIETLKLQYWNIKEWVADITKLLEYSKTLTQLTITGDKLHPQDDILLIADSLTVNSSVKEFNYSNEHMDQAATLKFLEKLKQAFTVEEVTLGVSYQAYSDYQFLRDLEKCVQQINHIRNTRGVSSLLKVKIVNCYNI